MKMALVYLPCLTSVNFENPKNKSDQVCCIVKSSGSPVSTFYELNVFSLIIDGPTLVHMLRRQSRSKLQHYCDHIYGSKFLIILKTAGMVDLVFGRYLEQSFKKTQGSRENYCPRVNVKSDVFTQKFFTKLLDHSKIIEYLFTFVQKISPRLTCPERNRSFTPTVIRYCLA